MLVALRLALRVGRRSLPLPALMPPGVGRTGPTHCRDSSGVATLTCQLPGESNSPAPD